MDECNWNGMAQLSSTTVINELSHIPRTQSTLLGREVQLAVRLTVKADETHKQE